MSLVPSDNPLTIREGTQIEVRCVVNSNAYPAPTITWYLGSTNITSTTSINKTSIILTGNRQDNNKTLNCSATNNNKPPKTVVTTLNVECKYFIFRGKKWTFHILEQSVNQQTNKQTKVFIIWNWTAFTEIIITLLWSFVLYIYQC